MRILGFNAFMNDAAAALLEDGLPLAAAEEERFTRRKHTGEFPGEALGWCLRSTGTQPADLAAVTFNMRPWHGLGRRLGLIARNLPGSLRIYSNQGVKWTRMVRAREILRRHLGPCDGVSEPYFHYLYHHLCHAAGVFYPSPFEEAAILVWDGSGEIASTLLARGRGRRLEVLGMIDFPHSLGYLYSAITDFLGFRVHGGEGKVMGLAPYGDNSYHAFFERLVHLEPEGRFRLDLSYFDFHRGGPRLFSRKLVQELGPSREPESALTPRDEAVAAGLQHVFEHIGFHLLRHLGKCTGLRNLCISGGNGLNGIFNGKVVEQSDFTSVQVQPAASDAGCALGGPLYLYHHVWGRERVAWPTQALLGPAYDEAACRAVLAEAGVSFERVEDPAADAAEALADGAIIGWFQGRMEFGPRALGNRSILADPRSPEIKDQLNARVKHREGFRPFAPAILAEFQGEYFTSDAPSPYMLHIYPIRPEKRAVIPSVTHVDGSGRLQSVDREHNPLFRRLIEQFYRRTGVPVVLNTSFNVRGEPIVRTPSEALRCFQSTEMDRLYLGSWLVKKS
jgi:carbamoyltransferase